MEINADIKSSLRQRIADERKNQLNKSSDDLYKLLVDGKIVKTAGNLLFHTKPTALPQKLTDLLSQIENNFADADLKLKKNLLHFLVKFAIDLASFLPEWNILKELYRPTVKKLSKQTSDTLKKMIAVDKEAANTIIQNIKNETAARLKAEGVTDQARADALTESLLGSSLTDYVANIAAEIRNSNLPNVARQKLAGNTQTELGNDYAAFLQYMIWLGGSFVTTNPVLIKLAWDIAPDLWNEKVDMLIRDNYTTDEIIELLNNKKNKLARALENINSLVTMTVVEENCLLLRDIFLITAGRSGYVSLQVNPKNHDNVVLMVSEAKKLYRDLENRLNGVPNVVFKLPGTAAGLAAAEELTSLGIGVTITVQFSVFQALDFGRVLSKGCALVCYLALMNGRMAFPARDEMKNRNIPNGPEATRWAGVEVARKTYRLLYSPEDSGGLGVDPDRVKLLIASLRVYDNWIPDITELWGCPVITIFPDVRRSFDSTKRDFNPLSVNNQTPADQMDIMFESEIFKQAWWTPQDNHRGKPDHALTLYEKDAADLIAWPPVANTLGQFTELYDQMGEMVKNRFIQLTK